MSIFSYLKKPARVAGSSPEVSLKTLEEELDGKK